MWEKRSCGEKIIENTLKELGVNFQAEKRLENSQQRFDFYFENQKYKIAIEFNGEQHYKETNYFSCNLKTYQERDERKRKYCKDNNINLYVISYKFKNEEIKDMVKKIVKSSTTKVGQAPEKAFHPLKEDDDIVSSL